MFKLIRRKILEGIVNDIINEMPRLKVSARILFREKKNEILKKIEEAVVNTVKGIFEKELG